MVILFGQWHPIHLPLFGTNVRLNLPKRQGMARCTEDTVLSGTVNVATTTDKNIPSMSLLDLILNSLHDDKAEDIVAIDLAGKSSIADHMVVASGRSTRQVVSLSEKLQQRIKEATGKAPGLEGKGPGDWVLVDAGDVIVHIFRPEVREFYQLEKMWLGEEGADPAKA